MNCPYCGGSMVYSVGPANACYFECVECDHVFPKGDWRLADLEAERQRRDSYDERVASMSRDELLVECRRLLDDVNYEAAERWEDPSLRTLVGDLLYLSDPPVN